MSSKDKPRSRSPAHKKSRSPSIKKSSKREKSRSPPRRERSRSPPRYIVVSASKNYFFYRRRSRSYSPRGGRAGGSDKPPGWDRDGEPCPCIGVFGILSIARIFYNLCRSVSEYKPRRYRRRFWRIWKD